MRSPRYAEEMFPMKEISEISSREKNIRHGNISTLHIWWARRPIASSRAMNYASLIPIPDKIEDIQRKKDFIVMLSKWESASDHFLLEKAFKDIVSANDGKPPKVLDPFAGGGSIPLEALRLGCETYVSDYNPVATLILKCTLELVQKYCESKISPELGLVTEQKNQFVEDIMKWGEWILEKTKKELIKYYPNRGRDIPLGYIWARTIPCQNPSCNAEIPLLRQYWLVRRGNKQVSLYPYTYNKMVKFKLVGDGFEKFPKNFDASKGNISRAVATCLVCGSVVDNKTTARLFREHKSGQRVIVVISYKDGTIGKKYRLSSDDDIRVFNQAVRHLEVKKRQLMGKFGFDPVPDEFTPEGKGKGAERAFSVRNFGMNSWGDLFNARQKLTLITLVENVRNAHDEMLKEYDAEYAKAIVTYIAILIDKISSGSNTLCRWQVSRETIADVFGRGIIPIVWDYIEVNPLTGASRSYKELFSDILTITKALSQIRSSATVTQSSATSLAYPDNFFDAVFTDPPYYDNVPYSYLSDFFYVWLKRTIGDLYPELFSTSLTPKSKEIVAYSNIDGGFDAGKKFFEDMLKKSLQEISRVLKPNGVCYIVYAHKSTAGWETLINSLLDSGLVVTAAWPINTEMRERLRAAESAALASSIYMIAGKYKKTNIGFYRDVRKDLKKHLTNELDKLWNEGVSGADFLVAAIGSAIEVFGMYEKIIDDEGNEIRADKLLEQIRRIVTDYAVRQVLHNGFASEISQMTRIYLLWRWAYGEAKIPFDDARKLAQSVGLDLTHNWNKGFIQKDKEFIRILGPQDRNVEEIVDSNELIDILHRVLLLWNNGKGSEVLDVLQHSGLGKNDTFYRIAQAISESLPNESKEKKWLEGFLAGKARISKQIKVESGQRRLFE